MDRRVRTLRKQEKEMFIQRDFKRTEEDDFKINVEPKLHEGNEAAPQWALPPGCYIAGREEVVGWKIQRRYE